MGRIDAYAVCWPMIEEIIWSNLLYKNVIVLEKVHTIPQDIIEKLKGQNVVLFGSYWAQDTVDYLYKVASDVEIKVFSHEDLNKYSANVTYEEDLLEDKHYEKHPWIKYLLKRTRPGTSKQCEYFYRGLLDLGVMFGCEGIEDLLPTLLNSKRQLFVEEDVINVGKTICNHQERDAKDIVKRYSIMGTMHSYSACLVVGGPQPVMPLVMAAAEKATVGIDVRFYANCNQTRITFYTYDKDCDLSFVQTKLGGGGRKECKGTTIDGWFSSVDTLKEYLEFN